MDIVFDTFVEYPQLLDGMPHDEYLYYTKILDFVIMRLRPLEYQINTEEQEREGRFIMVYTLEVEKGPFRFFNYSEELTLKMTSCFSQEDINYLEADIVKTLGKG